MNFNLPQLTYNPAYMSPLPTMPTTTLTALPPVTPGLQNDPLSMLQRVWQTINAMPSPTGPTKPEQNILGMPTSQFVKTAGTMAAAISPRNRFGQMEWPGRLGATAVGLVGQEEEQRQRELENKLNIMQSLTHFIPQAYKPSAFEEYLQNPEEYGRFMSLRHPPTTGPLIPGTEEAEALQQGLKLLGPRPEYPYSEEPEIAGIASKYRPLELRPPTQAEQLEAIGTLGRAGKYGQTIGGTVAKDIYGRESEFELAREAPEEYREYQRAKRLGKLGAGGGGGAADELLREKRELDVRAKATNLAAKDLQMRYGKDVFMVNTLTGDIFMNPNYGTPAQREKIYAEWKNLSNKYLPKEMRESIPAHSGKTKGDLWKEVGKTGSASKGIKYLMDTYGYNEQQARDLIRQGMQQGQIK